MRIVNGLDITELRDIHINVWFRDADDNAVLASSNPNDSDALFFITPDSMSGVTGIDGNGVIAPGAQADIYWLIIPAPGAGGQTDAGLLYQVGATLSYSLGGESETVNVAPDFIQVRPMPRLELDYFLPYEVLANDPLTPEEEPSIPFDLGVRVTNAGYGPARNLAIESAQPQIVENQQGLLIQFDLLNTQVNDQPAVNSLLADFGDLSPGAGSIAIWQMTTSLYGHFLSFEADYYHSDDLGGELTSLIDRVDTHTLVRTVRNDLPGRDSVRDFLARDGDVLRLYESEGIDTVVTDQSDQSTLTLFSTQPGLEFYALEFPATTGPVYTVVPDPSAGQGTIASVWRSDGKQILDVNFWQAPTKITGDWTHQLHVFDVNSTGHYEIVFQVETPPNSPPELSPVSDQEVIAGQVLEMAFSATDPDDDVLSFTLQPLPSGANFTDGGDGHATLVWATDAASVGVHDLVISVSDGEAVVSDSFRITVVDDPAGSLVVTADLPIEVTNTGISDSFTIHLGSAPQADVWVPLASSDETRGLLDIDGVIFTVNDWNVPQTVWVHGVEAEAFLGPLEFEILVGPSESADEHYQGLAHSPLPAIYKDASEASLLVMPASGLATAGEGTAARFRLGLNRQPTEPVTITLTSSHPEYGVPQPATVTIDPELWNEPQQVVIVGQPVEDPAIGETLYLIDAISIDSADAMFAELTMTPVEVVHRDGITWGLEAGTVELPAIEEDSDWVPVWFDQPFQEIPVVVWLGDDGENDPSAVRIRNVTTEGFEALQVEPPKAHGFTDATMLHYLAVEPGVHPLPGGGLIEVGTVATSRVQQGAGFPGRPINSWEMVEFEAEFAEPPVWLAGIQTLANEPELHPSQPSTPWLTVASSNVQIQGAFLALERSRVIAGTVTQPEMVGYIALSPGESQFATNIGWTDLRAQELIEPAGPWREGCHGYTWFADATAAAVLLAHPVTRFNNQAGGWLRLCSDENDQPGLVMDSDVERSPQRGHRPEDIRALWFSQPFHTRLPGINETD